MIHLYLPNVRERRRLQAEKSRGFTLIEMLVVIAIIAILMSMIFPLVSSAREKAQSIKCLSNLKGMGEMVLMFASEHDGMWPRHNTVGAVWPGRWYSQLQPYSKAENIYSYKGYRCPSKDRSGVPWPDAMYGINGETSCQDNSGSPNRVFTRAWAWNRFLQVQSPSKMVLYADSNSAVFHWRIYGGSGILGPAPEALEYGYTGPVNSLSGLDPVHNGRVNLLHADGHVSSVHVSEWMDESGFVEYAIRHFHPRQDLSQTPGSPPPGMTW